MFQSGWFSLDLKSPQELLGGGAGDREEVFDALINEMFIESSDSNNNAIEIMQNQVKTWKSP